MEKKPTRMAPIALTVIVGLLLGYPASLGPAAFFLGFIDWGSLGIPVCDSFNRFYLPLKNLPHPINGWMCEWERYGLEFGHCVGDRQPRL